MIKMWQHPLLLLGHGKFHYKSAILMFLLCICVCFLSSCGNVKENTESQVSEAKKFKNYASDIWSASGNKITFGNKIILTSYHGENNYAYITNNAGKTWIPYEIDNLKGSNHVNGVSIQKDDKRNIWVLTLQIATNHELKTAIYTSNDLWKSWSKVQNSVQKAT